MKICRKKSFAMPTNADKIRAMTDEELCDFLVHHGPCDQISLIDCMSNCSECIMQWLKRTAEEGTT